jgi:hypothetical protein
MPPTGVDIPAADHNLAATDVVYYDHVATDMMRKYNARFKELSHGTFGGPRTLAQYAAIVAAPYQVGTVLPAGSCGVLAVSWNAVRHMCGGVFLRRVVPCAGSLPTGLCTTLGMACLQLHSSMNWPCLGAVF